MYSDLDSCVIIQRGLQRDPVLGDDGHPPHPAAALDPLECFFNFFCHGRVVTTGTVALCHCVTTRSPATLTVYNPPSSHQAPEPPFIIFSWAPSRHLNLQGIDYQYL